jgi:hypothetical protein
MPLVEKKELTGRNKFLALIGRLKLLKLDCKLCVKEYTTTFTGDDTLKSITIGNTKYSFKDSQNTSGESEINAALKSIKLPVGFCFCDQAVVFDYIDKDTITMFSVLPIVFEIITEE